MEGPESLLSLEQPQPLLEVVLARLQEWAEERRVCPPERGRIRTVAAARPNVDELLDRLGRRRRLERPRLDSLDDRARGVTERVLVADGVDEHRRVEDDPARRPRSASSSRRSADGRGTSMGSAERIRRAAGAPLVA